MRGRSRGLRSLALGLAASAAISGAALRANAASRQDAERAFMLTTRASETANQLTSNIPYYVGRHVKLICSIDSIVTATTLIGQCGKDVEPVDIYVRMPTKGHVIGDKFRVLGVVEPPAVWADALGHQVYYPIVRAVYTDPTTLAQ